MPSAILRLPSETWEEIFLTAIRQTPLGPPTLLHSLHLTCRAFHRLLTSEFHPTFFGQVFIDKFDAAISHSRLGIRNMLPAHLQDELHTHCAALQCIRQVVSDGYFDHPQLLATFRTAYLMLLADDGKNLAQLNAVGLPSLVHRYLMTRWLPPAYENNGWPVENEMNSLVVALFWQLASQSTLDEETSQLRDEVKALLAPCAYAAFRYPCFNTSSESRFDPSDPNPTTVHKTEYTSPHGSYPPPRIQPVEMTYFGEPITFKCPNLGLFAILSYFVRTESRSVSIPPHLPLTRAEAIAQGRAGPTQEDITFFNSKCKTRFANSTPAEAWKAITRSRRHDPDWFRAVSLPRLLDGSSSQQILHLPGTFTGQWTGSHIAPCMLGYKELLSNLDYPPELHNKLAAARSPHYVTFKEHYCYSPSLTVPWQDEEEWFKNGFLPPGCRIIDIEDGVRITDDKGSFSSFYETYKPDPINNVDASLNERPPPHSRFFGAVDIIITGQTNPSHALAWGGFRYMGRIRPCDGMVVLLREPMNRDQVEYGRTILRGYLVSSQNFVGRLRHVAFTNHESIFSLCKLEDPGA